MKSSLQTAALLTALIFGMVNPLCAQVPDLTKDAASVDRKQTYKPDPSGGRDVAILSHYKLPSFVNLPVLGSRPQAWASFTFSSMIHVFNSSFSARSEAM